MKKNLTLKIVALFCASILIGSTAVACASGNSKVGQETMSTTAAMYPNEAAPGANGGVPNLDYQTTDSIEPMPTVTGQGNEPIAVAPPDTIRKIISTVNTDLIVADVQEVVAKLKLATEQMGGYISRASVYESNGYYYADISLRIPSEKVEGFTTGLSDYGKITRSETSTDDVTDSYYDIAARLKNAQQQEAKLVEIMDKANTVEDMLRVRDELDAVQERIEQFQGKLQMWDQLTAYSTVNLNITAEERFTANDDPGVKPMGLAALWESIKNGFSNSLTGIANFFSGLLIGLSYVLIPLLLVALFALIIFLIVRTILKKQAKKRAAQLKNTPAYPTQYYGIPQEQNPVQPTEEPLNTALEAEKKTNEDELKQ